MNYNRANLKRTVRQLMKTSHPRPFVVSLLYAILTSVPVGVLSGVMWGVLFAGSAGAAWWEEPAFAVGALGFSGLIFLFLFVAATLYTTVMSYGYIGYNLKVYQGLPGQYGDLFSGFAVAGKAIGTAVMTSILVFLWSLPALLVHALGTALAMGLFSLADETYSIAAGLLLAVLGLLVILASYAGLFVWQMYVSARYSLAPYFIMTDPDMGVFDAITASKAAMRGNTGKWVVLLLSFLGWILLEIAAIFGIILVAVLGAAIFMAFALAAGLEETGVAVLTVLAMLLMYAGVMVVSLLFSTWLSAYVNLTCAGFFRVVTGLGPLPSDPAAFVPRMPAPPTPPAPAIRPAIPPIPPAPPVPPAPDPFGEVETPKVEDPFDQAAPQAPGLPAQPETPTPPEPPAEE